LRAFLVFNRIDGGDDFLFFNLDNLTFVFAVVDLFGFCLGPLIQAEVGAKVVVNGGSGTGCWRLAGGRSPFLACRPLLSGTACALGPA
jgi:hypothetical protein